MCSGSGVRRVDGFLERRGGKTRRNVKETPPWLFRVGPSGWLAESKDAAATSRVVDSDSDARRCSLVYKYRTQQRSSAPTCGRVVVALDAGTKRRDRLLWFGRLRHREQASERPCEVEVRAGVFSSGPVCFFRSHF